MPNETISECGRKYTTFRGITTFSTLDIRLDHVIESTIDDPNYEFYVDGERYRAEIVGSVLIIRKIATNEII